MLHKNDNCDGACCTVATGQVRVLPMGAGGNLILCRDCYAHEIRYRAERNRELSDDARFDTPAWADLTIYSA